HVGEGPAMRSLREASSRMSWRRTVAFAAYERMGPQFARRLTLSGRIVATDSRRSRSERPVGVGSEATTHLPVRTAAVGWTSRHLRALSFRYRSVSSMQIGRA